MDFTKLVVKTPNYEEINKVIPKEIGVYGREGMRLAKLAFGRPLIVEIGSHKGRSAAFMASTLKYTKTVGTVYSIDVWYNVEVFKEFLDNMIKLRLDNYVMPIREDSLEVAKTWDREIDMLLIDGNHKYESVSSDGEAWIPFVKKGGVVCFHDYGAKGWPGVKRYVEEQTYVKGIGLHHVLWSGLKK